MGERTQVTKEVKETTEVEREDPREDDENLPKEMPSPTVQKTGDVKSKDD